MSAPRQELTRADEARAHRLGFRARSRSLELGLRFALLGAVFAWLSARGASLAASWATLLPGSAKAPTLDALGEAGRLLVLTLMGLSLLVGVGAIASAWLTRNFGPRRGGNPTTSEAPSWGRALMAFAAGGAAWVLFRGVLAGAARGSAASLDGLHELWWGWAVRTPLLLSAILGAVGAFEWVLSRQRARRAYAQAKAGKDERGEGRAR